MEVVQTIGTRRVYLGERGSSYRQAAVIDLLL